MARTMQTAPQNTGDPPPPTQSPLSATSSSAQSSPQISPIYRSPHTLHNNNNNRRGKDMNNETTAAAMACLQTQAQDEIRLAQSFSAGDAIQLAQSFSAGDAGLAELQLLDIQVAKKRLIDAQNQQKLL